MRVSVWTKDVPTIYWCPRPIGPKRDERSYGLGEIRFVIAALITT
jgi:hypothetical protein